MVPIHQVLLPNLHQSTHERIWSMEKTLQITLLMTSLRDGNDIEILLMTALINTDFVNHPVPSTTEPSTSLVRVGTDVKISDVGWRVMSSRRVSLKIRRVGE
ncbi:uncharacterized protein TNCV_3366411 [Trichonephila clavipes]|nr:uncharacterized protein TNCV_3366411 [Trichonephila clavipes]